MGGGPGVAYREPGRTYLSAWLLAGILALGWILDGLLGGAAVHAIGWAIAIVVVVGVDLLSVRAARSTRTITVTPTELRVGEHAVERSKIVSVLAEPPAGAPVLGRLPGSGLPRTVPGLGLRLVDGSALVVPTRHPERLTAALAISMSVPAVRPATPDELGALGEIEERADTLFTVAGYGPLPTVHTGLRDPLMVLVAGRPPVGFARITELDGQAHLDQISVLPGCMRRGIGSALLQASCVWARERGYLRITVLTFENVPWNAPFYAARGFAPMAETGPELAELRDWERDLGLDRIGPRVAMVRRLGDSEG